MPRKASATKTQVIERFDPDEDFSDVDGDLTNEFALDEDSQDPGRHYVWVRNDVESIGDYKGHVLKYKLEHYTKDGVVPRMRAEAKDDEMITRRDHVLMSCDRALFEKRERFERRKNDALRDGFMRKALRPETFDFRDGGDGFEKVAAWKRGQPKTQSMEE